MWSRGAGGQHGARGRACTGGVPGRTRDKLGTRVACGEKTGRLGQSQRKVLTVCLLRLFGF